MSSAETAPRVLIVDDEPAIVATLAAALEHQGLAVRRAGSGKQALEYAAHWSPDLILLDLGLPDLDGLAVIRAVRARGDLPPIVVLSARETESDKVAALELGADDYLTKPFGPRELLARVKVALRHALRAPRTDPGPFRAGPLTVDLERRLVTVAGAEVHLTPTEYQLLATFVAAPNRVLTDRMLLQRVWGPEYGDEDHYLHVYIARLRKKLGADPRDPRYLITVPGVGYRLLADE